MIMVMLLVSFTAYAGNGNQKREQTKNNVCSNVLSGTPDTIEGTVIGIGSYNGLVIDVYNDGQVTIYGIGPDWYWEKNKVDRPDIGDHVKVEAYEALFSDGTRYIASSITRFGASGEIIYTLYLRDTETGCPLWRGARNR